MNKFRKIMRVLLKWLTRILCLVLACGLITACITASILAVDVIHGESFDDVVSKVQTRVHSFFSKKVTAKTPAQLKAFIVNELKDIQRRQSETDEKLLAELNSGAYSFEQPMIVLNPYGISPLTAMLLFQTEQPVNISIHIDGDSKLAEVDYTFEGFNTTHALPVYGLYPNRLNTVQLTARDRNGAVLQTSLRIQTDRLPDAFSHETVRAYALDESAYQPGFTFTFAGNNNAANRSALDINGTHRWCLDLHGSEQLFHSASYVSNYNGGNSVFLGIGNVSEYGPAAVVEVNLLGKLLNAWYTPYGVHHDIDVHEDCIWVAGNAKPAYQESLVCCFDRKTGELKKTIDLMNILQPYRNQIQHSKDAEDRYYSYHDWCHLNSITAHGDKLVLSVRNQSTVLCMDSDGNIQWMLADPKDYFNYFRQFILEPVGENFTYFYVQHAADVLPDQDDNPDTVDILLFDNGDFRVDDADKVSRMVQYRIDEKNRTVRQIWSWGEEMTEIYSNIRGDADLLANGNRLGSFDPKDEKAKLNYAYGIEVDPEGKAVWECWRTSNDSDHNYSEYRLERLMIYADSANDLKLGVSANLFLQAAE